MKLLTLICVTLFGVGCAAHKPVGYHISVPSSCLTKNVEMDGCTSPNKCQHIVMAYKPECSTVSAEK